MNQERRCQQCCKVYGRGNSSFLPSAPFYDSGMAVGTVLVERVRRCAPSPQCLQAVVQRLPYVIPHAAALRSYGPKNGRRGGCARRQVPSGVLPPAVTPPRESRFSGAAQNPGACMRQRAAVWVPRTARA